MVWWHGWESHRHRGDVGGAVETRHGVSLRVLLGSRLGILGARPVGIVLVVVDDGQFGGVGRPLTERPLSSNYRRTVDAVYYLEYLSGKLTFYVIYGHYL